MTCSRMLVTRDTEPVPESRLSAPCPPVSPPREPRPACLRRGACTVAVGYPQLALTLAFRIQAPLAVAERSEEKKVLGSGSAAALSRESQHPLPCGLLVRTGKAAGKKMEFCVRLNATLLCRLCLCLCLRLCLLNPAHHAPQGPPPLALAALAEDREGAAAAGLSGGSRRSKETFPAGGKRRENKQKTTVP